jgi:hypothetical protein
LVNRGIDEKAGAHPALFDDALRAAVLPQIVVTHDDFASGYVLQRRRRDRVPLQLRNELVRQSRRPTEPVIADRDQGMHPENRFASDSPLEEEGFELLVPPSKRTAVRRARPLFFRARLHRLRSFK